MPSKRPREAHTKPGAERRWVTYALVVMIALLCSYTLHRVAELENRVRVIHTEIGDPTMPEPKVTAWTHEGSEFKISTAQNPGEGNAEWQERHDALVAEAKKAFPPD